MSHPFDATLKDLIEGHPADWVSFAGQSTSAPIEAIDADLSTITAAADKVLRVSDVTPWLLHLELQTGNDPDLGERLHWYNALLRHRHRLRVRTVAVLLRPQADAPRLTGHYEEQFPGEAPYLEFRYRLIRLWQVPAEQLLAGGPGTLPLALLSGAAEEALSNVVSRIDDRLAREVGSEVRATLLTAAFVLAGLRLTKEGAARLFQGVSIMQESTTYQMIIDQGKTQEARKILLRQGRKRFGVPDAGTTAALETVNDIDRLERMSERLLDVANWAELLATT